MAESVSVKECFGLGFNALKVIAMTIDHAAWMEIETYARLKRRS